MTKLNRRSMLAGVAAMPFLPSMSFAAQSHHSTGTRWLYAYIHGAFVIEFQPGGVRLLAPRVADTAGNLYHEYRAGYLPNGEGTPLAPALPVALTGLLGAGTSPQFDKTVLPCFDNAPLGPSGHVYCGIALPTPDAVVPLRQVPQASDKTPFFDNNPKLKDLKWLPLLLLLQYELQPTDRPTLVGAGASWRDDGRNPLILHFRAEPGSSGTAYHEALTEVGAIVNQPLNLNGCYAGTFSCAKNSEEQTLIEMRNPSLTCKAVLPCAKESKEHETMFGRPANCVGIVVNNTGS